MVMVHRRCRCCHCRLTSSLDAGNYVGRAASVLKQRRWMIRPESSQRDAGSIGRVLDRNNAVLTVFMQSIGEATLAEWSALAEQQGPDIVGVNTFKNSK